jgi:hypothetical protein
MAGALSGPRSPAGVKPGSASENSIVGERADQDRDGALCQNRDMVLAVIFEPLRRLLDYLWEPPQG